ncbi:MAG TPA: IPT/TIG domain-containing protein [Oscillatoriaceae cyanobacterium]
MKVYRVILASIIGATLISCVGSPTTPSPTVVRRTGGSGTRTLSSSPSTSPTDGTDATTSPDDTSSASPSPTPTPTPSATGTASPTAAPFFAEVLDGSSKPVTGVTIDAYGSDGSSAGTEVSTDSNGQFKPATDWKLPATLIATAQDSTKAIQFNVASGTTSLKMQLAATGSITGQLTAPNLNPAPDFTGVQVKIPDTPFSTQSNSTGSFTLPALPAYATGYNLAASSNTLGTGAASNIAVSAGKTASATIALSATAPTVSSLSATNGGPGVLVTITGTHFGTTGTPTVSFNGTDATTVTLASDTSLTAAVPAQATNGNVTVAVNGLTSNGENFKVLQSLTVSGPQTLSAGATQPYTVAALDTNGDTVANPTITWASAGTGFTISPAGLVTATGAGTGSIFASSGNLQSNSLALTITSSQVTVSTFAGSGSAGTTNGTGTGASFIRPVGLCFDPSGTGFLVASDEYQNQNNASDPNTGSTIRALTSGAVVTTLAGQTGGDGALGNTNGSGAAAKFYFPDSVAVDSHGNIFVADTANNLIRKVTPAGLVSTFAGSGEATRLDGTGTGAKFNAPWGICCDPSDNLYVTEIGDLTQANEAVRKITPGGVVTTVTVGTFKLPQGIAADGSGNVFLADGQGNVILKIANQTVSTYAGSGAPGEADGTGIAATFNDPTGLAIDANGNLYVADNGGNKIRKIAPGGAVSTIAGDGTAAFKDGSGTSAEFNGPNGIAIDSQGNLYVADTNNYRIRKITLQ